MPPLVLRGERLRRYRELPGNIVAHDLARGIPLPDGSLDVVYHSHMLEHIDRERVAGFQREVWASPTRKPGGVQRVVVPDLEILARRYLASLDEVRARQGAALRGTRPSVVELLGREERAAGRGRRAVAAGAGAEVSTRGCSATRGRAAKPTSGCTTRSTCARCCEDCGFRDIEVMAYDRSRIAGWADYGLDVDAAGRQYKPDSLYVEAVK